MLKNQVKKITQNMIFTLFIMETAKQVFMNGSDIKVKAVPLIKETKTFFVPFFPTAKFRLTLLSSKGRGELRP